MYMYELEYRCRLTIYGSSTESFLLGLPDIKAYNYIGLLSNVTTAVWSKEAYIVFHAQAPQSVGR